MNGLHILANTLMFYHTGKLQSSNSNRPFVKARKPSVTDGQTDRQTDRQRDTQKKMREKER